MIKMADLYSLIEESFVFLMVVDGDEQVVHCSEHLKKQRCPHHPEALERGLENALTPNSLASFRQAVADVRSGAKGVHALLSMQGDHHPSLPMTVAHLDTDGGDLFLFFGAQLDTLAKLSDWEKEERIKELSCLYSVADWIEVSATIPDFFRKLPEHLARGMRYPEESIVCSSYNGVQYGRELTNDKFLHVDLTVNGEVKGNIRIGYIDPARNLLPEEQKMLDEIGRMLNTAIGRKELAETMIRKQVEESDVQERLAKMEAAITDREKELEAQKQKLSTVDSYLNRVNRDWDVASRRLDTMFQAIPDQVMLIDMDLNVVMSNQEEHVPGDKCYRTYFGRETPCEDCRLSHVLQHGAPITSTMRKGDKHLQVHTLPVFNQEEEVDGIIEFFRDVTLEKTYEQQLQQADKLASLGQLVSGIGHEINNPNQFIRGNVKIIRQALEDMLPIVDAHAAQHPDLKIARLKYDFFRDHIMTLVDDMAHGSERIKGIVDGLRSFARKDEGHLVDTVDVNTLIQSTTRLVQNEVHKYAEIELDLAPDLAPFVGNSQKIEQVLVNLIVNAAQAMPDDHKGVVRVRTAKDGGMIVITIEDNGKGMDANTQKQIFDPFFTTKRTKGGTGLGLAIAFRIIEEHGGNISVNSKLGSGTKFTLRIPAGTKGETADTP